MAMVKVKRLIPGKVRISGTSGHVVWITNKWQDIPEELVEQALTKHCITEEMAKKAEAEALSGEEVAPKIEKVFQSRPETEDASESGGEGGNKLVEEADPNEVLAEVEEDTKPASLRANVRKPKASKKKKG